MRSIPLYPPDCTEFGTNGLGLMLPISGTVEEEINGKYDLEMQQPITDDFRWAQLTTGCILKAAVPKRESPLYDTTDIAPGEPVTVTRKVYRVQTNGGRINLRTKATSNSKSLGLYKPGTEVVQLDDAGNNWYHVMVIEGGATGYMYVPYLRYVRDVSDVVDGTKPVTRNAVKVLPARNQLFRIYSVENDTQEGIQTAKAMHIFYDLRGNIINREYAPEDEDAATVIATAFSALEHEHDFTLHLGPITGKITGDYSYMSFVEALLDPDEGMLKQCGALLVRDNYDIYIIPDEIRDTGVTIRRRKNLVGVKVTTDDADVITRIIPCGKDKDGEPLFLNPPHRDSPYINDYPFIRTKKIDFDVSVSDAKDAEFKTNAEARAELERLTQLEFDNGCDLATYGMEVDFVMLGNTPGYEDVEGLQAVHLLDTVTVIDSLIKVRSKIRSTAYVWDFLAEQYTDMTLGSLHNMQQTTYGFNLPDGGISGTKITPNSAPGTILRDLSVQYGKFEVAAVEQLNAEAVNAITGKFGSIEAGDIETDELYAAIAHIIELAAGSISAGQIDVDRLAAALAEVVSLRAATGDFDLATIQNLLANALILQQGQAGSMQIINLAVTSANILNATLGELVLKGEDGRYYRVFVGSNGEISTETATVTGDEIAAGKTQAGNAIVGTSANIADLNAQTVKAASAIISTIFTEALTAGKITAGEALIASATIPELYVTSIKAIGDSIDISANETIRLLLGTDENIKRWFRFDEDGMTTGKPGSTYSTRTDDTGFHIQQLGEAIGSFSKRTMAAENVRIGKVNTFEPRFVLRESPDGGMMIAMEGLV